MVRRNTNPPRVRRAVQQRRRRRVDVREREHPEARFGRSFPRLHLRRGELRQTREPQRRVARVQREGQQVAAGEVAALHAVAPAEDDSEDGEFPDDVEDALESAPRHSMSNTSVARRVGELTEARRLDGVAARELDRVRAVAPRQVARLHG